MPEMSIKELAIRVRDGQATGQDHSFSYFRWLMRELSFIVGLFFCALNRSRNQFSMRYSIAFICTIFPGSCCVA